MVNKDLDDESGYPRQDIMDFKLFATVFGTVFIAELGDKTQLATLLYASDSDNSRFTVFLASALALIVASALGVMAGSLLAQFVNPAVVRWVAGLGFIAVGVWVILSGDSTAV